MATDGVSSSEETLFYAHFPDKQAIHTPKRPKGGSSLICIKNHILMNEIEKVAQANIIATIVDGEEVYKA